MGFLPYLSHAHPILLSALSAGYAHSLSSSVHLSIYLSAADIYMPPTSSHCSSSFTYRFRSLQYFFNLSLPVNQDLQVSHLVQRVEPSSTLRASSESYVTMHLQAFNSIIALLAVFTLTSATVLNEPLNQRFAFHPRQIQPSSCVTSRSANTEFLCVTTVTPPDPSATGTQTTTHDANTEIEPSPNTGSAPPIVTTDSRSANTQAVGPSTMSSAFAMPTGAVNMEAVLGAVAVGIAGMV